MTTVCGSPNAALARSRFFDSTLPAKQRTYAAISKSLGISISHVKTLGAREGWHQQLKRMAEALPAAGNQRIMEDFARALDTANRAMVALDEISQQMRVLRDDKTVSPKLKTSKSRLLKTEGALLKATHSAAVASFTGINSLMRKRNNGQPPQQPERLLPSAGGLNGERATNVQEVDEDALLFEE